MPLEDPMNDKLCLRKLKNHAQERMRTPEARELARNFKNVYELAEHIRAKPQRDDMGDPLDGPRVACDVSQRLRFFAPDPACFERTGDFLALAPLIEPHVDLTCATMMLDNGLHTFPVEIRNGVPRAIVLDPLTTDLHNAMNATAFQLRNASPMARDLIGPWFADLARNACHARGAEECHQVAMDALRTSLLTGQPIRDPEAIECVLGLAYEDAQLFGTAGVMAHDRVCRSIRNLGLAIDKKRVAEFMNDLVQIAEPMAMDAIKAAMIAKFGPVAAIALQGVDLGVANQNQPKRKQLPASVEPTQEEDDPAEDDIDEKSDHQDNQATKRAKGRAAARRMTFAFRNTHKKGA